MTFKRSSHAIYDLHYHFMWATKYRKNVLTPEIQKNIKRICHEIAEHYEFTIEEIKVMDDHLHVLVETPPRYAPAQIAQYLKGRTIMLILRQFPQLKKTLLGRGNLGRWLLRKIGRRAV